MRVSYFVFFLLGCFCAGNVTAQTIDMDKATVDDVEWSEGTVTLTDGKVLSGLLRLNTKTGILGYESGATSKSFTPRNVLGFSYFDEQQQRERKFLSIAYSDTKPKDDGTFAVLKKDRQKTKQELAVPKFFEILVEYKTFALVSTIGRLTIKQKGGNHSTDVTMGSYGSPSTTYSNNEDLLILAEDGTFEIVLEVTTTEVDRTMLDNKKTKGKVEEIVIEKYTAPYYDEIVAYARERKLKFKDRDDLIQIFEYYKTLAAD